MNLMGPRASDSGKETVLILESGTIYTKGHGHTLDHYSAIKKEKINKLTTTYMNLTNIMLSERSQIQKTYIYYMTSFI